MKKVKLSILALLAVAAVAPSCKKGDEDPGLSLRSRKSRLAGEWKVKSYESEETQNLKTNMTSNNYTTTTVINEKFDGGTYTKTVKFTSTQNPNYSCVTTNSDETHSGSVTSYTITIEKDGTWSSEKEWVVTSKKVNSTSVCSYGSSSNTTTNTGDEYNTTNTTRKYTYKEVAKGTWQFTGKNKGIEEKNKESVVLATTELEITTKSDITSSGNNTVSTAVNKYTYGKNENVAVWHITQLKNKSLIVDGVSDYSSSGTNTTGGTTTTNNDWSSKGSFKITLEQ